MDMYVIQVRFRCETSVCCELKKQGFDAILPTVNEYIRRGGKWSIHERRIFTQYVFIRFEPSEINYYRIRKIRGIIKFLDCNQPLKYNEQKYIEWLENGGKPIEPSEINVNPDGRITVVSGILKNYSDNEIKYNIRQRKADVFIKIAGCEHKVTLPVVCI